MRCLSCLSTNRKDQLLKNEGTMFDAGSGKNNLFQSRVQRRHLQLGYRVEVSGVRMLDARGTVRTSFTDIGQDMVYGLDSWLNGYMVMGLIWLCRLYGLGFFMETKYPD